MGRPKLQRTPTEDDLDSNGLLKRNHAVDSFIISELTGAPQALVDIDHPGVDTWYKPAPLAPVCAKLKLPVTLFNRIRVSFYYVAPDGGKLHYPIVLGRTLYQTMSRLSAKRQENGEPPMTSLKEVLTYYDAKRERLLAKRKAERRTTKSGDLEKLKGDVVKYRHIITKLRSKLNPVAQAKLDVIMTQQGLTVCGVEVNHG